MKPRGRVPGPAHTYFNDYVGTVAADDAEVVFERPSLYELAQIDRDRYTILAIDLRVDGQVTAIVYAIDRVEHRISLNGSDIVELGQSWGEIPIVQFNPPEPNVEVFIRHALQTDLRPVGDRRSATMSLSSPRHAREIGEGLDAHKDDAEPASQAAP
jgi:hypothetical protein